MAGRRGSLPADRCLACSSRKTTASVKPRNFKKLAAADDALTVELKKLWVADGK